VTINGDRRRRLAAPARGHGFGKQLMKRAGLYAVKRACTDAFLDAFSFKRDPFMENSDIAFLEPLRTIRPDTNI
jgi:hypothetical protein